MGLHRGSQLACFINMRGEARGGLTPYMPPHETLAATSSWLNSEALAACVEAFDPCTCGLC
jgi:hypothetical protein